MAEVIEDNKLNLIKKLDIQFGLDKSEFLDIVDVDILEQKCEIIEICQEVYIKIYNKIIYLLQDSIIDIDYLFKLENKSFALEAINIVKNIDGFKEETLRILLDKDECKKIFKNTYPVLKSIPNEAREEDIVKMTKDSSNKNRYYTDIIEINNKKYIVTNNWHYGSTWGDSRTPFVEWIKELINHKQTENIYDQQLSNDGIYAEEIDEYSLDQNRDVTAEKLYLTKKLKHNYLVFGAPGTGKSYDLKKKQESYFTQENSYERVTFYSNYSYAQFVGTYKPKMVNNEINYSYVAGPFIRMLVKAYQNPQQNFLLIIEEINRANPAAVFGDIFQLLDRKDNGVSEYDIETSEDLREYLATQLVSGYRQSRNTMLKNKALEKYRKIRLPENLYIWATMNSADQGVFPMDTAFKRRWEYKYMDINAGEIEGKAFKLGKNKEVEWNILRKAINEILIDVGINEDKLMGPFFIGLKSLESQEVFEEAFKSKVLMYLFEDAAKQYRKKIFKNEKVCRTYSILCEYFDRDGIEIFKEIDNKIDKVKKLDNSTTNSN